MVVVVVSGADNDGGVKSQYKKSQIRIPNKIKDSMRHTRQQSTVTRSIHRFE